MSESDTTEVDQLSAYTGFPQFFPSLLAYIRSVSPTLPIQPVILHSLLICIIAGRKHLILRTSEEDIHLVVKLAAKMLSSIFGFSAHKVKLRKSESPDWPSRKSTNHFLRSLFIYSAPSLHTTRSFHDETSTLKGNYRHKRPVSRHRTARSTVHYGKTAFPNDSSRSSQLANGSPSHTPDPFTEQQHHRTPSVISGLLSNVPSNPFATASRNSSSSAIHPGFPHSYSDPTPLKHFKEGHMQLPSAIVISGIEHASTPVQRALNTVLSEKTIVLEEDDKASLNTGASLNKNFRHSRSIYEEKEVMENDEGGVWSLPDDFILVYVCSVDEWERPSIHKPLLDKFAMSVTITLNSNIRSQLTSISRPMSFRGSPILSPVPLLPGHAPSSSTQPFIQTIPTRQMSPGMLSTNSNKSTNLSPLIPSELMRHLRKTYSKVHFPSTLNIYISDLFSAARHYPQLDGTLLSATALSEAFELTRASRVLGGSPTGMELIFDKVERNPKPIGSAESVSDEDGDFSLNMEPPWIDVANYDHTGNGYAAVGNGNGMSTLHPLASDGSGLVMENEFQDGGSREVEVRVLDVTQADVARIFPRVVTHRVRVRNGPEDEVLAGAFFGATSASYVYGAEAIKARRIEENHITVKDIMVKVLNMVN